MSKRWYAVQAFSGYEKIVQKGLLERISQSEISDQFGEILVPVEEVTTVVKIDGFVGKPEAAKRTRGEQYFFVNGRFIKSNYLNHAVSKAFEELIPGIPLPTEK